MDFTKKGVLMTNYLRPLGLVFGPDAKAMIASGQAASLGGMGNIGFTGIEAISRSGKTITRKTTSWMDFRDDALLHEITRPRPAFGGVAMNRCQIMGIVNVTPDSFSDGGQNFDPTVAIANAKAMAEEGAAILDIGGESTRPGSNAVDESEESARILPVIAGLAKEHKISADTRKPAIMREAVAAGAKIINDVSALTFAVDSAKTAAELKAPVILMHAQGEPRTMQLAPKYDDVALDVYDALAAHIARAEAAGIPKSMICVDPGIGFGKTFKQNLELLQQLTMFHGLGVPLLIGLSRKGYLGALTSEKTAAKRVSASIGGALQAAMSGAHILRAHDVKETLAALTVFESTLEPHSADI